MTAQLITLVMIAYVGTGAGVTSQKIGDFYDMGACATAARAAALIGTTSDVHVRFACVPLTPVSSSSMRPKP